MLALLVAACSSTPTAPTTSAQFVAVASSTPALTQAPAATLRPTPRTTPRPTPTAPPTALPAPASLTGETRVYTIAPRDYAEARIRGNSTIEVLPDGAVKVVSTRESKADQYVEWITEPTTVLPPGAEAATVLTIVCGSGEGDWWEVYGPYGSDEFEYELVPPRPDGCWHFNERGRYTDFRVEIWLSGNATMTISRIEFHVTFK